MLFATVGPLRKVSLAYDATGKSKGTAEVTFVRKNDAIRAMADYNQRLLDGRPMRIELTTTQVAAFLPMVAGASSAAAAPKAIAAGKQQAPKQKSGAVAAKKVQPRRRRRGPKPDGGANNKAKTAEELDAEMDTYMAGPAAAPAPTTNA
jgi:THO complex subunit 4